MRFLYELIGRLWVLILRRRFGRQLRLVASIGFAVAAVAAAYLFASRDVEEG